MKISEVIAPDAIDDAEIAGTTPDGGVIVKTKDGTEIVINDPSRFYKDPRDGAVHMKSGDEQPQGYSQQGAKSNTANQRAQTQKLRPGDKVVVDKPTGNDNRSF